jgi:hypothetical protein
MKRNDILKKLKAQALTMGLSFEIVELTNHTGVVVDGFRSTLARHSEIDDVTAHKFFDQFAEKLGGKGWWR